MTTRDYLQDLYGRAVAWNSYFAWTLAGALAIIAWDRVEIHGLTERLAAVKPVYIRFDDLGRHDVIQADDATDSRPRSNEIRTFLRTFTRLHYSLLRNSIARDFQESLFFLNDPLSEEAMRVTKTAEIDPFLASYSADEVDIQNIQPKLTQLETAPYRAEVAFDKVFYQSGTRTIRKPNETFVLHLTFELRPPTAGRFLEINPLGIRITSKRLEAAYRSSPQQAQK